MSLPLSFCDECYPASYEECADILFIVGLTPLTQYTAVITNHFNQQYYQTVTTDGGGSFTLDTAGFPEGFFNPFAGFYVLTVEDVAGNAETMTIGYTSYDCVSFDIYTSTDANP